MSMRDLGKIDVSNISKPLKQGLQILHDGAVGQVVHPQAGHPLHIAWWPSEHPGALEISLQNEECLTLLKMKTFQTPVKFTKKRGQMLPDVKLLHSCLKTTFKFRRNAGTE